MSAPQALCGRAAGALAMAAAAGTFLPAGASGLLALLWLAASLSGLLLGHWTARREGLLWLLLWVFWMGLSLSWTSAPRHVWAREASHVVMLLSVPVLAASITPALAARALRAFVAGALLLVAAWLWHAWQPWPMGTPVASLVHYVGNKSISNGALMALAATLALHGALLAPAGTSARWGWSLASLALAAAVLGGSASRTAHSLLLTLPWVLAWWHADTFRSRAALAGGALVLGVAGWVWMSAETAPGGLAARSAAGQLQASDDYRRALYQATADMVRERPLRGQGLGAWSTEWQRRSDRPDMRDFSTAHSAPLQLWAEGGLVAVVLLGAAVLSWAAAARRAGVSRSGRQPGHGSTGAPLAISLLAFGAASLVNATLRDAVFTAPMVVLLALGLAHLQTAPQAALPAAQGDTPPPRR